jgi:putative chitinase
MNLALDHIRRASLNAPTEPNARAIIVALDRYGARFGLDQPHRLAQFLAQLMHESFDFRYDREVWGPTAAQQRYDVRTDLGNTPARDGDGKLYMGRTGIQITGKANYAAFRDWCRANIDPKAPDFVATPEAVNSDPWEGLAPIWYWSTRKLNRAADEGDAEMITRKINGGLNGYDDRLRRLARVSLVLLGYGPEEVERFQRDAGVDLVDGIAGPKTRAALHRRRCGPAGGQGRAGRRREAGRRGAGADRQAGHSDDGVLGLAFPARRPRRPRRRNLAR